MKTFFIFSLKTVACLLMVTALLAVSVKAQSITVSNLSGMDFGTIAAGDGASITPNDASAALFKISVDESGHTDNGNQKDNGRGHHHDVQVQVTFSLPNNLLMQSYSIPVTFSSQSAIWNTQNSTQGGTIFDPRQQKTLTMKYDSGSYQDLYIYLGGGIQTSQGQHAGTYNTTVVMTVTSTDD